MSDFGTKEIHNRVRYYPMAAVGMDSLKYERSGVLA